MKHKLSNRQPELWNLHRGARVLGPPGVEFRVWAPLLKSLEVKIMGQQQRTLPMSVSEGGEFCLTVPDLMPGIEYFYSLPGGRLRPDPVSRSQPHGVHGPSRVVDPAAFEWHDQSWRGIPRENCLIYELHTGTFTAEGTFEAIIPQLDRLKDLGITAVELMPVGEFPGSRNWGYDVAYPYAPQFSYGGVSGLKKLIDACHEKSLAVVLDVVYNHLGPEGNYLGEYGPYFTQAYKTPWGAAVNLDGPDSEGVRKYFIENALYWLAEYHIDALRLDAIHGIFDSSPRHFLAELSEVFHRHAAHLGRRAWLIAESNQNDARVILPRDAGGYGMDALWCDDFHHSILSNMTGNRSGYLEDFGSLAELRNALKDGIVFDGRYTKGRRRSRGQASKQTPGSALVAYIQNHDQIANTFRGERLASLVPFEHYKICATLLLCAPFLPMLFMGQELAETTPFLYFTSHGDPELAAAVREGRRKEFAGQWLEGDLSDPQALQTFLACKIDLDNWNDGRRRESYLLHQRLISLRKERAALANCRKDLVSVQCDEPRGWLMMERADPGGCRALIACNFREQAQKISLGPEGTGWELALWTGAVEYGGAPGGTAPPTTLSCLEEEPLCLTLGGRSAAIYFGRSRTCRK